MSGMTSCNCELQNINARAPQQTGAFGATSPPTWEHRHAAVGEARSKLRPRRQGGSKIEERDGDRSLCRDNQGCGGSISSGDDNESSTNAKEVANARPYQRNRSAASAADACRERERMRKTERLKERENNREKEASRSLTMSESHEAGEE